MIDVIKNSREYLLFRQHQQDRGFPRRISAGNSWNSVSFMQDVANYSDERSTRELCKEKNPCRPHFPVISKGLRSTKPTNGERVIINAVSRFFSYFSLKRFYRANGASEKKVNRSIAGKVFYVSYYGKKSRDFISSHFHTRVSHEI